MAAQAHLNVEAHQWEVLNDNFRKWDHVRFPQPFFSSSSVIIETFEPGSPVSGILDMYDALAADISSEVGSVSVEEVDEDDGGDSQDLGNELIPVKLAQFIVTTGLSIYLKMLLLDNLMVRLQTHVYFTFHADSHFVYDSQHADLHPGNLMLDIHDNGSSESSTPSNAVVPVGIDHVLKNDVCVCLVDAGMVAQLTDEESANFIGVLCSLGEGDGKLAAECALRFSKENSKLTEEERQAFIHDIILVFEERCQGYHTNVDVGHVLRGILSVIRKHHVRIDANYATLVVNALCVESLARRVCPSYNVLDASKPMLQSYRKIAYTKDGVPIKVSHQAVKRAMPLMNFRKDRQDNAFFKERLRTLKRNQKK
jgi:aarF domain-containing kinase